MSTVVFGNPSGTLNADYVPFEASRIIIRPYDQSYQSFSNAPGIQRSAQAGVTKKVISDLSGGLLTAPDIRDFTTDYNRYRVNRGIQTRIEGLAVLPFTITNQSSITNDEDISGAVAANWRIHSLNSSVGGAQRWYAGLGNRFYRANATTGAWEVASGNIDSAGANVSMGAVITAIAELKVNGSKVVAVALKGAANIVYTTDPTASTITWTTLVNTSSGDYITGMSYFDTLGPGVNVVVGKVGGTNSVWYALGSDAAAWTLSTLVLAATKDEDGSLATTDTGPKYAVWAVSDFANQINNSGAPGFYAFGNPSNAVGDTTGTFAAFEPQLDAAIGDTTGPLYLGGFDFSAVPLDAIVDGVYLEIEKELTDSDGNVADMSVVLLVNGSQKGIDRPNADGYWPTTKGFVTYGSTTDKWGADWTGADLQSLVVRIKAGHPFEIPAAGMTLNTTARVSRVRLTARWHMPGAAVSLPIGGYQLKRNDAFPLRMTVVVPDADETDTILRPRRMWHIDFAWDTATERPVMAEQQTNFGMLNIHAATPQQGGWLAAGDNVIGPGSLVKTQDVNGDLRNYRFGAYHDGAEQRVATVFEQGIWGIYDVVSSDYTERQWWYGLEDVYYPDTLQQSLTDLQIAAQPIPWAEAEINLAQRLIYSVFPNSTDTAVARQHLPSNLSLDPRLIDTDKTKAITDAGGRVYVESPLFAVGPAEALQTILVTAYQGVDVNDDNNVQLQVAVDGAAFASSAIDHTFTDELETYNVPQAGVACQYIQYRLGLYRTTSGTPNGLPILLTTEQEWPSEQQIIVFASDFSKSGNVFETIVAMQAVQSARSVQPLWLLPYPSDNQALPCVYEGLIWPPNGLDMPPESDVRTEVFEKLQQITVRNREEVVTPVEIGFVFRTVPGIGS